MARPFVKWAGGKAQLLPQLKAILPTKARTYFEPFVGGGALFFALAAEDGFFQRAVINDWNAELMTAYKIIRDFPDDLCATLHTLKVRYQADPQTTYSEARAVNPATLHPLGRAARFLFLNRTGYNGLYRVNRKGEFNVPFGKYVNPRICDETNIKACSTVLDHFVHIMCDDFEKAVAGAGPGDLVYFDPPYVPLTKTSNFTAYTAGGFGYAEHQRLAKLFKDLAAAGVAVVASNSNTDVVRDLYEGYEMHCVDARRNINRDGDKRGPVRELIIVGRRG